ncbi:MAG: DUF2179 domain-containing protein [candidate division KSB1 bacterium]|nr:DUF2179 domain-containing protein [candidate division KSB1 bacterium]
MSALLNSPWFTWVILPILIFCARIVDVSIGTMRIIFIAKEKRFLAPLLGFFEVLIWLLAIGQIFKHLDNALCYVAYAGGFATGNYVGMLLERRLALGTEVVRLITRQDPSELLRALQAEGFGTTVIDGYGSTGPVKIIFTLIRRKDRPHLLELIQEYTPGTFFSIEDVREAQAGVFPQTSRERKLILNLRRWNRKRK